ncbi:MAG TPA: hypothetical protein VLN45_03315, partial [Ignavibacteriaceae bacterium]|nr:hypothetical protein [Ignavibacteriaceae bacterium]
NEIARGILISITSIILAISIFYVLQTGWGFFHDDVMVDFKNGIQIRDNEDAKYETTFFEEDFSDSLKQATFYFKSGAGSFKIKDTTEKLFSAVVTGYDNNYNITRLDEGEMTKLHFENDRDSHFIFPGKNRNKVNISLNSSPVWDMKFDVGAAYSKFDLRNFKVEELDIKTGAAKLELVLGELIDSAHVDIDAGVSKIEISVPENTGCEINSHISLSKKDFDGFNKIDDDLYRTENFSSSTKKIFMNIDTGVSSVKIKRYSGETW